MITAGRDCQRQAPEHLDFQFNVYFGQLTNRLDNEFRWQDKDDEDTLFTSDEVKGWVQIERPIDPAADAERARHERSDAAYYQGLRDKDSGGSGLQIY